MFVLPADEQLLFRILGVDPGSDTMGVAVIELNMLTGSIGLLEANTYSGHALMKTVPHVLEVHGPRTARLWGHQENMERLFRLHHPQMVVSESPFLGRFPQAFAALTECISAIRRAVYMFDPLMPLLQVDPPTVKLAVGVKARGTDKDDVKRALIKATFYENTGGLDIASLDEHSVDAICVALTKAIEIRNNILSQPRGLV